MEFETNKVYLDQAGFKIIHHYYRPDNKSREQQPWLAIVAQRLDINEQEMYLASNTTNK